MRELLNIFIAGVPLSRPHLMPNKFTGGTYIQWRAYEPSVKGAPRVRKLWDAERWRDRITAAVQANRPPHPAYTGGVILRADFYFPRFAYQLLAGYSSDAIEHDQRPDIDNLEKVLQDAITAANLFKVGNGEREIVCVWKDDSQICEKDTTKWFVARGGKPGVKLVVDAITDPEPKLFESKFEPKKEIPVHPASLLPAGIENGSVRGVPGRPLAVCIGPPSSLR